MSPEVHRDGFTATPMFMSKLQGTKHFCYLFKSIMRPLATLAVLCVYVLHSMWQYGDVQGEFPFGVRDAEMDARDAEENQAILMLRVPL